MILGLSVFAGSMFSIPLATGATLTPALLLALQQVGDGFLVVYETNQVTLRQALAPELVLGRVNATFQFLNLGASLVASLLAGLSAGVFGVRPILLIGCCCALIAVVALTASPLRRFRGRNPLQDG